VSDVTFIDLIAKAGEQGGFETDDVLAIVLPLMRQVAEAHKTGHVAPLDGIAALQVPPDGHLAYDPSVVLSPRKNHSAVQQLQLPASRAVEVRGEHRRASDLDSGSVEIASLDVSASAENITKPVYLPGYRSWEQAIGHHDEVTDVFSLGMILATLAVGHDLADVEELDVFVRSRENLFALNPRLNPVVASVIVQMTELNRHKRTQQVSEVIQRLENYREQVIDLDTELNRLKGFKESPLAGKRRLIQSHLRDRLFEISRRNRLIYFQPTMQTLNLTIASVPLALDYRNIKLEQLFVWHPQLAATVIEGAPMSLGKYLRFEDAPYISGVLDKLISEARRDRAEYGFAQLRLVLCFLRWHNLKESPQERIHSPLLLLPVELTKKKGVRDNYVLDPTTSEAEVNPALRHHLKQLYNLDLPATVDLRETSLDQFHELLRAQIHASEPGVTLNKIERPQIELIHERARQRVDQYKRRMKVKARKARSATPKDYSYERQNFRPLGLQLFLEKIRPTPAPLRDIAGAPPQPRTPHMVEPAADASEGKVMQTERETYALRDGDSRNPYSWDFDLCSLTLGNFNYRKMTLVRDYANLIEADLSSRAFDRIFSLEPRPPEQTPPPLPLSDQHLIIACDATQASAIARARTGASYIIQGPPGTGKSQTITNLIADYAARGKRVLFVCEKRAAIDVVFHRLRQQGLDELCCLIHDSQTDKKEFIQNLKQTYEKFLTEGEVASERDEKRDATLRTMEQDLANFRRFSDAMRTAYPAAGVPLRSLLHRLVEVSSGKTELAPELEEQLPEYRLWLAHGDLIQRLATALRDLGVEPCFAKQPLRWIGKAILQSDRPLHTLTSSIEKSEELLDAVESALELSGLSSELWDTIEEIETILTFARDALPLAERNLLGLLVDKSAVREAFAALQSEIEARAEVWRKAKEKTGNWREPLSPDDTANALVQARSFEGSIFRFLNPAFWRLRKTLRMRYDFSRHSVEPAWTKLLGELGAEQTAASAYNESLERARREWHVTDHETFLQSVAQLRSSPALAHPSVRALIAEFTRHSDAPQLIRNLAGIHAQFTELNDTLQALLAEHRGFDFPTLTETLAGLREQTSFLPELLPVLSELAELPDQVAHALRHLPLALDEFEGAMALRTLHDIYRQDRALSRVEGRTLAQRMDRLKKHYREWLSNNAACIRSRVRRQFFEHVKISAASATQLNADEKAFKKNYSAGRRDLEHEFGKTMRYKSIRDLASGQSGLVIGDLKPIWLMSPLSVSDTLPLDSELFDVVIFDEASQIPVEEAIPAVYRSHQVIVVGDEMQLPPTTFFAAARSDEESVVVEEEGERIEVDLDSDSFLTQAASNLPSTLLAWHYRSRYEALISFSNAAFYSGNLYTIPDRQRTLPDSGELSITSPEKAAQNANELLARSISFHFQEDGTYTDRRNAAEATYIAHLVRALLARETGLSIGIVAFSEAQQAEIEEALSRLGDEDKEFAVRLETEFTREENDQFVGLFVKNLENVQGDERDIIILSICYGYDANGRMLMNFGPINQRGGEKRLNVIFSRAKHHMAVISSIRHEDITNDYNDGANSLKNFLRYAELISKGDENARRVLENLNPLVRKSLAPELQRDAVISALAAALESRGYKVATNVGQSKFRCDLAVRLPSDSLFRLGVFVDSEGHYANNDLLDRYFIQPSILCAFGWEFALVLTKDWLHEPENVLTRLERLLKGEAVEEPTSLEPIESAAPSKAPVATPLVRPPSLPKAETIPPPPKVTTTANQGPARYFEFVSGASKKFWEIARTGNSFTVRFGRIGTPGQSQTKNFADEVAAESEGEKLIHEKLRKGYVEKK
jgi:predicted DNA-binding WGR domain protein